MTVLRQSDTAWEVLKARLQYRLDNALAIIMKNTERSTFAEFVVAVALGVHNKAPTECLPYDLEHRSREA